MAIVQRPISAATREAVSRLVARYFLVHLQAELNKPDAVLYEDYPHLAVRDIFNGLVERTRREFSIAPEDPVPAENLFRTWSDLNGKFLYEEGAFVTYNIAFIARLLDLRDGTSESRDHLRAEMRAAFERFDYEKQGFTVAFFLESEGNMRELLRSAVRRHLPEIADEADRLVLQQSRGHQLAMYEYFEGLLKKTLAENVRLLHGILPEKIADELKRNGPRRAGSLLGSRGALHRFREVQPDRRAPAALRRDRPSRYLLHRVRPHRRPVRAGENQDDRRFLHGRGRRARDARRRHPRGLRRGAGDARCHRPHFRIDEVRRLEQSASGCMSGRSSPA